MSRILKSLNQTNPFIRFIFVGMFNTLISFFIMIVLLEFGKWGYWPSTFFGNSCGVVCSFFLNRTFTFRSESEIWKGGLLFLLVTTVSYFIAYGTSPFIANFFATFFVTKEQWAVFFGMIIYTVLNFFGQKHIVFQK